MYQELVARAAVLIREDYKQEPPPPATEEALRRRTRDELNEDVPGGYLDFLRVTDGLMYNGLFLYGTVEENSFVEKNLEWRSYEEHNKYLIFGDGDISLYALNLITGRYELQDRPSGTVMETFDTFDALVAEALRPYVQEDGEDDDDE